MNWLKGAPGLFIGWSGLVQVFVMGIVLIHNDHVTIWCQEVQSIA
jgi:hypothetical protein